MKPCLKINSYLFLDVAVVGGFVQNFTVAIENVLVGGSCERCKLIVHPQKRGAGTGIEAAVLDNNVYSGDRRLHSLSAVPAPAVL